MDSSTGKLGLLPGLAYCLILMGIVSIHASELSESRHHF
jgi:hypothetical protein